MLSPWLRAGKHSLFNALPRHQTGADRPSDGFEAANRLGVNLGKGVYVVRQLTPRSTWTRGSTDRLQHRPTARSPQQLQALVSPERLQYPPSWADSSIHPTHVGGRVIDSLISENQTVHPHARGTRICPPWRVSKKRFIPTHVGERSGVRHGRFIASTDRHPLTTPISRTAAHHVRSPCLRARPRPVTSSPPIQCTTAHPVLRTGRLV